MCSLLEREASLSPLLIQIPTSLYTCNSESSIFSFQSLPFSFFLSLESAASKSMGFPVGYTEAFFPSGFLHALSLLAFIRSLVFSLFRFLGLSDFIETEVAWPESQARMPDDPSPSVLLIRELLPVVKFGELVVSGAGEAPESCAVCLYEFEEEEEIRCMSNCKHIFHRACLDRWMDHDHKTCPLCRTPFVPDHLQEEYNQRLWAASGAFEFYGDYTSV